MRPLYLGLYRTGRGRLGYRSMIDGNALYARDVDALQKAQTLSHQPHALITFIIAGIVGLFGALAAIVSVMANPIAGGIALGLIVVLVGLSVVTKAGSNLMIGVVVISGLIVAALAVTAAVTAFAL